jgi:hypothetical protein
MAKSLTAEYRVRQRVEAPQEQAALTHLQALIESLNQAFQFGFQRNISISNSIHRGRSGRRVFEFLFDAATHLTASRNASNFSGATTSVGSGQREFLNDLGTRFD